MRMFTLRDKHRIAALDPARQSSGTYVYIPVASRFPPGSARFSLSAPQHSTVEGRNRTDNPVLKPAPQGRRQEGIALITVLFLMTVLGLLGGAILYATQLQTISTSSYAASSRAYYIADAGLQQAVNWFHYTYPTYQASDSGYTSASVNNKPVEEYSSNPVELVSSGSGSNYPSSGAISSFQTAIGAVGANGTVSITATLVTIENITLNEDVSNVLTPENFTVERWKLESAGTWNQTAQAQVDGYVEQGVYLNNETIPISNYALFSTGKTCGSITLSGGVSTNSYNSNVCSYSSSGCAQNSGGDVGSYGNVNASGGVTINGNFYVPGGQKVSSCDSSNPQGLQEPQYMNGSVMSLPSTNTLPSPPLATTNTSLSLPAPTSCNGGSNNCYTLAANCTQSGSGSSFSSSCSSSTDGYGNINLTSNNVLVLPGGSGGATNVYYINSISSAGAADIEVSPAGPVIINLVGSNLVNNQLLNLDGGSVSNTSSPLVPADLQILSPSSGNISIAGGAEAAFVLYTPNASLNVSGGSDIFGSLVAASIADTGGTQIHFDQALRNTNTITISNNTTYPFYLVSWNRVVN